MLGKTCTEREHASDLRPRPRRRRRGRRRRSRGLFSLCTRDNKRQTDTVERRGGDFTPSLLPPWRTFCVLRDHDDGPLSRDWSP